MLHMLPSASVLWYNEDRSLAVKFLMHEKQSIQHSSSSHVSSLAHNRLTLQLTCHICIYPPKHPYMYCGVSANACPWRESKSYAKAYGRFGLWDTPHPNLIAGLLSTDCCIGFD